MSHRFRFRTTWRVAAPAPRLFEVLQDVDRYAVWWPQVRAVRRVDAESVEATIRSRIVDPVLRFNHAHMMLSLIHI